jgi:hypothetical protein
MFVCISGLRASLYSSIEKFYLCCTVKKNFKTCRSVVAVLFLIVSCGQDELSSEDPPTGVLLQKIDGGANDAPVLDSSKTPVLAPVKQDVSAPVGVVGTSVASLVDMASIPGQLDNVSDVDSNTSLGIAVTSVNASNGTWYFSTNNGTTWSLLGAVSSSSSRLLAADGLTRIYFQPNIGFSGSVTSAVTFRAWDRTTDTNGSLVSTTTQGGTTAFSTSTDTASIEVIPRISIVASSTGSSASEATTVTASLPSGTTDGDVLIAALSLYAFSTVITPPSGWTLIRTTESGTSPNFVLVTYYKIANGEPSSYPTRRKTPPFRA